MTRVFESEPSGLSEKMRPPLRSSTNRRPLEERESVMWPPEQGVADTKFTATIGDVERHSQSLQARRTCLPPKQGTLSHAIPNRRRGRSWASQFPPRGA